MFNFENANEAQREAIAAAEGPVLITAGPGTGKTYTLVQRTIYLIEECGVKPESIFIATFTEKAAKELITRVTNELASRNMVGDGRMNARVLNLVVNKRKQKRPAGQFMPGRPFLVVFYKGIARGYSFRRAKRGGITACVNRRVTAGRA